MASWEDVRELALALPDTDEALSRGTRSWRVAARPKPKLFVWERPLRASDLRALGDGAPAGPILGEQRVLGTEVLDACAEDRAGGSGVAEDPTVYFTTPHFDGYPAVLVALERIARDELEEIVIDAWLARAPARLARAYLAERRPS